MDGWVENGKTARWMGGEKIKCESARQLCLPCKRTEQTGGGGSEEGGDHSHHRHHHHGGTTPISHRPSRLSLRVASADSTERTPERTKTRPRVRRGGQVVTSMTFSACGVWTGSLQHLHSFVHRIFIRSPCADPDLLERPVVGCLFGYLGASPCEEWRGLWLRDTVRGRGGGLR